MQIRVLGSGAGGGFPQWNCSCPNCKAVRAGTIKTSTRNQSSIAVSSDGEHWVLFNASPDVRAQLESFPEIHPKNASTTTTKFAKNVPGMSGKSPENIPKIDQKLLEMSKSVRNMS